MLRTAYLCFGLSPLLASGCTGSRSAPSTAREMCRQREALEAHAAESRGHADWGARCDERVACKPGLVCFRKRCEALPSCCSDAECDSGCVDGHCGQPGPLSQPKPGS